MSILAAADPAGLLFVVILPLMWPAEFRLRPSVLDRFSDFSRILRSTSRPKQPKQPPSPHFISTEKLAFLKNEIIRLD